MGNRQDAFVFFAIKIIYSHGGFVKSMHFSVYIRVDFFFVMPIFCRKPLC